jgi:hypothetical protein
MRQSSRGQAQIWLDEWEKLVGGRIDEFLATLTSSSPKARELRQNSPFSGLLSDNQRNQVLDAWKFIRVKSAK